MTVNWLNIGSGFLYREGWVNVDKFKEDRVDILADLEHGLPFDDDTFDYVYASHVLEHIVNCADLIKDVHRVLKKGGIFEVYVPYGITASLYHVRFFFPNTMNVFIKFKVDLTRHTFEGSSEPLFKKVKLETTEYAIPFAWHLNHYFKTASLYL